MDTAESLTHFLPQARFIVLDDTGTGLGSRLDLPNSVVLPNEGEPGRHGLLYRRICAGFDEALRQPFDILLRIDDDAVVLGNTFAQRAQALFAREPDVALLGNHYQTYLLERRSFVHAARRIRRILVTRDALDDVERTLRVAQLYTRAKRYRYERGEHVLSAVSIWNPRAVEALRQAGLFADPGLVRTHMAEDHIFGLAIRSLGFRMQQFGTGEDDLPVGASRKGLPASPDELVAAGKELVHSTKSWCGRREEDVRATFRDARLTKLGLPGIDVGCTGTNSVTQ